MIGLLKVVLRNSLSSQHSRLLQYALTRTLQRRFASGIVTPVFLRADDFKWRTAIVDQHGRHTYGQILHSSNMLSKMIQSQCACIHNPDKITGPRMAILCSNDVSYVVAQWACWMLGGIAVPLSPSYPASELEYFLKDSGSTVVLSTSDYSEKIADLAQKLNIHHIELRPEDFKNKNSESPILQSLLSGTYEDFLARNMFKKQAAMIIYTSGTTGRPKGVVHTHGSLSANMDMMRTSWDMSRSDTLLHALPLHHTHGIVNALMTPLSVGATCIMLPKFDAKEVWTKLLHPLTTDPMTRTNLFMGVPTMYAKLSAYLEDSIYKKTGGKWTKDFVKAACLSRIRLMISGSASLPEPLMLQWERLTGHRLLERYGMTETGMVLTNPLLGPRIAGSVGRPFPGVEVRLVRANVYAENGYEAISTGNHRSTTNSEGCGRPAIEGEVHMKGANVFREYWNNPDATRDAFTQDGWLKTGDTAVHQNNVYKMLGRTSIDFIKSGGFKISGTEVERHLLTHPNIQEAVVVGLPDITWGQKVAAVVVLKPDTELTIEQLRVWARDVIPNYEIPVMLKCVDILPYNAMGKINKKKLMLSHFPAEMSVKL